MPQESLRSAVYRSFVTCDDPKGVAEYKTITRSKHKTTNQNAPSNLDKIPELQNLSSFQIMEVSKGAEKLNQVVNSWSNKPDYDDNRAKFVARDLLRGALNLQDSLMALSKLQQASKQSRKLPRDESREFTCCSRPLLLPSARHQTDQRDCYDELRKVIRESFARQNILPGKVAESSSMDFPCSSRSSSDGPSSRPNLIAKLMGLDEVPSRRVNLLNSIHEEKEKEKFSRFVDIDLDRLKKKTQIMEVKERRRLEDMVETIEFKGVLGRNDSFDDLRRSSAVADDPPIVIMKPLRRENHSINEEKKKEIIKNTTTLMHQNARGVQLPKPRKKKLDKYTQNKLSGANKCPDTRDRVPAVKMDRSKPPVPRMPKRESVVSKIDDQKPKPKIATSTRKLEAAKEAKCQVFGKSKTLDVGKKVSTLKRESCVSKGQVEVCKTRLKSSVPNRTLGKKGKPSKPSASLVENVVSDVNIESNIEGLLLKDIAEEVINSCYNVSISDNASPCESSELISKGVVEVMVGENSTSSRCSDESQDCKSQTNTRRLLLRSPSFLNHVEEELFDTRTYALLSDDSDKEAVDDPLLLDCAKELLSRKSLRCRTARMVNPSSQMLLDDKSIQEVVGEICDGIECLRNYSKCCGDVVEDSIYPMLERDLWWNEEVIGAWDLGWRKYGYTMEDMKEVVHDIERLMLNEFVDDLVVEFMQHL